MAGDETRVANGQGNYSSGVWVDVENPDILYTIATTIYRSTDGGKTFSAFKGGPGGEDPPAIQRPSGFVGRVAISRRLAR